MLKSDIGMGVFLLIVALFFFIGSFYIFQSSITAPLADASFFPRVLSAALAVASIYLIIKGVRKRIVAKGISTKEQKGVDNAIQREKPVLVMLIATTLYVIFTPIIGYLVTTLIFMSGTSLYLGRIIDKKRWQMTLLIVVGISILAYVLFSFALSVFLPQGILI
jgi:hypothetical protein